jgi:hypothetical protein
MVQAVCLLKVQISERKADLEPHGSKKGSIEPPSTLTDKLWQLVRYVGLCDRSLDIFKNPSKRYYGPRIVRTGSYQLEFALATSSKHKIR